MVARVLVFFASQHLELTDDDFRGVTLDAFFVGVFTGAQLAFQVAAGAFLGVAADDFRGLAEGGATVPFNEFLTLTGCFVGPAFVGGDGEVRDALTGWHEGNFRVVTQVADDGDFID